MLKKIFVLTFLVVFSSLSSFAVNAATVKTTSKPDTDFKVFILGESIESVEQKAKALLAKEEITDFMLQFGGQEFCSISHTFMDHNTSSYFEFYKGKLLSISTPFADGSDYNSISPANNLTELKKIICELYGFIEDKDVEAIVNNLDNYKEAEIYTWKIPNRKIIAITVERNDYLGEHKYQLNFKITSIPVSNMIDNDKKTEKTQLKNSL